MLVIRRKNQRACAIELHTEQNTTHTLVRPLRTPKEQQKNKETREHARARLCNAGERTHLPQLVRALLTANSLRLGSNTLR